MMGTEAHHVRVEEKWEWLHAWLDVTCGVMQCRTVCATGWTVAAVL